MDGKDVLIIANGEPIGDEAALAQGRTVVVLDGAADRLVDVVPDVILGDFDSIQQPRRWGIESTFGNLTGRETPYRRRNVLVIPAFDQAHTDLEKGLEYCKAAESICIINALGGRSDHMLSNISCLKRYPQAYIRTATETMRVRPTGVYPLSGTPGSRCALFGFPQATVTTHGLTFELTAVSLETGVRASTSNQIAHAPASVKVDGHALVIEPT